MHSASSFLLVGCLPPPVEEPCSRMHPPMCSFGNRLFLRHYSCLSFKRIKAVLRRFAPCSVNRFAYTQGEALHIESIPVLTKAPQAYSVCEYNSAANPPIFIPPNEPLFRYSYEIRLISFFTLIEKTALSAFQTAYLSVLRVKES